MRVCIQSYCAVWTTQRWSDRFHFFENDRFVLKRRKNKWQRPFVNDLLKEKIHLHGQNYFGQNVFRLFLSLKTTNIYKTTFITVSSWKKIKSIFIKLRFISEILFKMIFVLKTIVFHKKNPFTIWKNLSFFVLEKIKWVVRFQKRSLFSKNETIIIKRKKRNEKRSLSSSIVSKND